MPQPPLNILQTCFSHSWGGLEIQALEIAKKMQDRGHHIWLASCSRSRLEREAGLRGLNVLAFDVHGYFHPRIVWNLSRFLKRQRVDIIHCQLSKDIATLVPAMQMTGKTIPIVLSKRVGSYLSKKDPFHRYTYGHISRVIAISDVIHRNVLETTPVTADRVLTIHDAVDTEVFSPRRTDRHRVRTEFGLGDEAVVIGFVGRFSPGKGQEEFLHAANILRKKYPNVRFLIVGEASYREKAYEQSIHALCLSLELKPVVTFTGFRNDIPDLMAAFDIFAFPSHAESFGVALIEAMALELPVVSTNCDGVLDIVVNGETGLYVHPGNAIELAAALARLIDDPTLREKMGKAGRSRVEELFDQEKQIRKIERVYYDLLGIGAPLSHGHAEFSGVVRS